MTLKELNFFYKLSENPTVSQIAQEMNISQSAVSLAIKSLEEKLGEELFDRIGKKLILNERGRYFKKMTYPHFLAIYDSKTLFQKNKLAGYLNVAASKTIANYIMPNIYYKFLSKYKDVSLNMNSLNTTQIIEKILKGELDFGLIEASCNDVNIIKEKIIDDELIVVTSDKKAPKKAYIDTISKKWILRETGSGTRDIFIKRLGSLSDDLNIFMELYEFDEIKKILLKNSDTVTAISRVAVEDELKNKELFQIELINIDFKREFNIIYHKNKTANALFETFKEFIKKEIINKNYL
ncbi:LysR substrate-binding domain-containing protein [Halarcobacter anaerophilus]|uniref:LysR family transcriptional regulator n=1 Tax=Halarcobacter anaerophilus TaxID=877500 RepID=A0A4Q0XWK3_9BACT|nr:LysR substrate-binding domain-containing protein [Halarcobacter anaerophilus]QDF28774.1 transcriptional regulator, LysR family [Halarcobacter anaerophilus]RXJ61862.1 LysR family transcriptional regulator [Halarcobacter anaerophilus]